MIGFDLANLEIVPLDTTSSEGSSYSSSSFNKGGATIFFGEIIGLFDSSWSFKFIIVLVAGRRGLFDGTLIMNFVSELETSFYGAAGARTGWGLETSLLRGGGADTSRFYANVGIKLSSLCSDIFETAAAIVESVLSILMIAMVGVLFLADDLVGDSLIDLFAGDLKDSLVAAGFARDPLGALVFEGAFVPAFFGISYFLHTRPHSNYLSF